METTLQEKHPFVRSPNETFIKLSIPVLFSLIAEPLTGLVDTAFVSSLGAAPLAAMGVGTMVLSSFFWIFNFLGIGPQTEIAQTWGKQHIERAAEVNGLALALSGGIGVLTLIIGFPLLSWVATLMGASGEVHDHAVLYMKLRLLGSPAMLIAFAAFGVLRGLQEMNIPFMIAVIINVLNIVLDALLIFGLGPVPAMGIAGAAIASSISQWIGALWAVVAVYQRLGFPSRLKLSDALKFLKIGTDLFIRTGLLTFFLILTTRTATRIGADQGAAHQAIRQCWTFTALFLDAYAITAQSLVGYFIGANRIQLAKRVASVACLWSFGSGVVLGAAMWFGRTWIADLLVPDSAVYLFASPWLVAAVSQPVNALAFATDGIHWGTGDFRFLRNAVLAATGVGSIALLLLNIQTPAAFTWIWVIIGIWISIRAVLGMLRIWPGIGKGPF